MGKPTIPLKTPEAEARIEDYLFMREHGETFERAAARLGLSPDSLGRFLNNHGISIDRSNAA